MMREPLMSQIPNKKEIPEQDRLAVFVDTIISQNKSGSETEKEFEKIFKDSADFEKVNQLFDALMSYVWTKKEIRRTTRKKEKNQNENLEEEIEDVDPYLMEQMRYLWNDKTVREGFLKKYQEVSKDKKEYRNSDLGNEWKRINREIEIKEKEYKKLEQELFLGKISRSDKVNSAKTKISLRAKQLVDLRRKKEDVFNLEVDGEKNDTTPENTDILAQIGYENLREYHTQGEKGFVWLPSRMEIHHKTVASLQNGRWPVLIGEAGSGKSEQADAAAVELTGELPTHIACGERTNEKNLISDKDMEEGRSYEKYGPAMQAATGFENSLQEKPKFNSGRVVRFDESGKLGDQGYSVVKELRQKRSGSDLNGKKVLPGFSSIWTTNPTGPRYPDRKDPDAAMRRELAFIEVDYPPMTSENPELFEFMLSSLLHEKGNMEASKIELSPAYKFIEEAGNKKVSDSDSRIIVGRDELITDLSDKKHGMLYRLSFAIKAVQDAFVNGNKAEFNDEKLLRYKDDADGNIKIDANGEPLTLSSSTITLGEIASWMRGFNERKSKDDKNFQTDNMTDWIKYKLETYLNQSDASDREKIRAIFNHFHLLDELSAEEKLEIRNSQPLTAKEIGYLSPRVPRPLKLKNPEAESGENPDDVGKEGRNHETTAPLETIQVMLENGDMIKIKNHSFQFSKDGKMVDVHKNVGFEIEGEKFYFAGIVDDENSEHDKKLAVLMHSGRSDEQLYRIMSREEIENGEFPEMSVEIAREIMERGGKEKFLGPQDLENTFGIKLKPEDIDPIPFSREEIEKMQKLGYGLAYEMDEMSDGTPFNIENMAKSAIKVLGSNVLERDADGKPNKYLLYKNQFDDNGSIKSDAWFSNEAGILSQKPKRGWHFFSADILPNSTSKQALQQIDVLIENAKNNFFDGKFPLEYEEAEKEYLNKKSDIEKLVKDSNYVQASKQISELKISELLSEPVQNTIFRYLVSFKKGKQLFTDGKYSRSMYSPSSVGYLLSFGDAGSVGAFVVGSRPDVAGSILGAVSSRF